MKKLFSIISLLAILTTFLSACTNGTLTIVADESLRSLIEEHKLLQEFEKKENINTNVYYLPTVDAQNAVAAGTVEGKEIDVYLAENNAFIPNQMDKADFATTLISVFLDEDIANKIGWTPGSSHGIDEFKTHLNPNEINLITLNPATENNGLGFYAALLSSYKRNPGTTLTMTDVLSEEIKSKGKDFYSKNDRTFGTTPEAIDFYVQDKVSGANEYNAIVISESYSVDLLNKLHASETGYFFYLKDATMITTAGIGCNKNDNLANCQTLKKYLINSNQGQSVIANSNWRPAIFGVNPTQTYLKPENGFSLTPVFNYVPMPDITVINQGIEAYVLYYRPTVVVGICADKSGSMGSNGGIVQLNDALAKLFAYNPKTDSADNKWLRENKIFYSDFDKFIIRFFDDFPYEPMVHTGNDLSELSNFGRSVSYTNAQGGTAWRDCIQETLDDLVKNYPPSSRRIIILMGDGDDRDSNISLDTLISNWKTFGQNIPIISIGFGKAASQISYKNFGRYVNGQYYDGSTNLSEAFKKAYGNQ